jgi:hypothetical protein
MTCVPGAPIASPGDSHGRGEHFLAANDNHDIANRRIRITPDRNFRRSVIAVMATTFFARKRS